MYEGVCVCWWRGASHLKTVWQKHLTVLCLGKQESGHPGLMVPQRLTARKPAKSVQGCQDSVFGRAQRKLEGAAPRVNACKGANMVLGEGEACAKC